MTEFVERRLRSGQTLRYHTTPHIGNGQTVAEHAWRATVLLHTLWPEISREALLYMLYHDAAEQELGDIPAPAKWQHAQLAGEYKIAEFLVERDMEIQFDLTADEAICCKIADMLELVDHTAKRIMRGDHSFEARNIYWNGRKHLEKNYSIQPSFLRVRAYMDHLHAQVVQVCPLVGANAP